MRQTAKVFMHGQSQAVQLPESYQLGGEEVFVRRDHETGDIIISKKPGSWDDFFKLVESADVPEDFMVDRDKAPPQERDLF